MAIGMIAIARAVGNMIGTEMIGADLPMSDDMPVPPSSSICMSSGLRGHRSGRGSLIDMSTKPLSRLRWTHARSPLLAVKFGRFSQRHSREAAPGH
ncbi:hypothetical protein FBZ93_11663 [Bradyrhizobium macuxiense]|uniref:Uncharacterized protein n=2 Tax=Bradyrhizobium macuxiense TaxID=1755647 RepID=A0A560L1D6_9BRAD|nr:hypothetical protein FBZ93_11663 [Bradyrhizobium macuxiense]